jgi:hypothetical protein
VKEGSRGAKSRGASPLTRNIPATPPHDSTRHAALALPARPHGAAKKKGPDPMTGARPLLFRDLTRRSPRRCASGALSDEPRGDYFTAFTRGRFSPSAGSVGSGAGAPAAPGLPMPNFSSTSASTSL